MFITKIKNWLNKNKVYLYYPISLIFLFLVLSNNIIYISNNLFFDRLSGSNTVSPNIIVVKIDDKSLQKIGQWPWNKKIFNDTLHKIDEGNPRVIAYDILFLENQDDKETSEFKKTIKEAKSEIVLGNKLDVDNLTIKTSLTEEENQGFANYISDKDSKVRRMNLTQYSNVRTGSKCQVSFSYLVYTKFTGKEFDKNCDKDNQIGLDYSDGKFNSISFLDLYQGSIPSDFFKNKIVLVGSTLTDLQGGYEDNYINTKGENVAGVFLQAETINTLLTKRNLVHVNPILGYLIIFLICSLLLFIRVKMINNNIFLLCLFFFNIFFIVFCTVVILSFGYIWLFSESMVGILHSFLFTYYIKFVELQSKNKKITNIFEGYLHPAIIEELVNNQTNLLNGERKQITVFFSDLRGFTTFSESVDSRQLFNTLNIYFSYVCKVISNNSGTIDKFIGDAVMAFWNAPINQSNHAYLSVKTALEVIKTIEVFNKKYNKNFAVGVGINTGDMIVGSLGNDSKQSYTVIGDEVNIGSRMEGLTKKYGISILVSKTTLEQAEKFDFKREFIFRIIDDVVVKGKAKSISIYEPFYSTFQNINLVNPYNQAFELYRTGKFLEAKKIFKKIIVEYDDAPSKLMVSRIDSLILAGQDQSTWDGIHHWDEK